MQEALQAARDALRVEHMALRDDVRSIIDANEDLQAALAEARENVEGRPDGRRPGPRRGGRVPPQDG